MVERRYLGMTSLPEKTERALLALPTEQLLHTLNTRRTSGRCITGVGDHYCAVQMIAKAGLADAALQSKPLQQLTLEYEPVKASENTVRKPRQDAATEVFVRFTPDGESKPQVNSLRGQIYQYVKDRKKVAKSELDAHFKCDTRQYLVKLYEKKHIEWVA